MINSMKLITCDMKLNILLFHRINNQSNISDTLMSIHEKISPEEELDKNPYNLEKEIYVVDFANFKTALILREQILKLFMIPGASKYNNCRQI